MSRKIMQLWLFAVFVTTLIATTAQAVVLYEEDRQFINGVALLRDKQDSTAYYYLPTYPRVSLNSDGVPEMYMVKFVGRPGATEGEADQPSGGLLHFLFTLDLPQAQVDELEKELQKKVSGASLHGPVPLLVERSKNNADSPKASFRIISGVLNESSGKFEKTLVTSGVAPVTPGSKAAVAAVLDEAGATLLFDSLEGKLGASDVSVSITAYYEAAVTGFKGRVYADISTVYDHMLRLRNVQEDYTKAEIRDTIDSLVREGTIEVELTDRAGLDVSSQLPDTMLNLVSNQLTNMMFDTTQGLTALPEMEKAPKLSGREERSFFAQVFGGENQPKYISDNQYTLKNRQEIRRGTFNLSFTQNTTIKVPYNSSGNIKGIYKQFAESDGKFLRVVSLNDPAFRRRQVVFEVDPRLYDQFGPTITSASISMRKKYALNGQDDFTRDVRFSLMDVKEGSAFSMQKFVTYPYLGVTDESGDVFEYRMSWNFVGGRSITIPAEAGTYIESHETNIQVSPPVDLASIEVEIDRPSMEAAGQRRAELQIRYRLLGLNDRKNIGLHVSRGADLITTSLLHDPESTPERRVVWTANNTKVICEVWQPLIDQSYILLNAEQTEATEENCESS